MAPRTRKRGPKSASQGAVEELYRTFTYRIPPRLDYCTYCDDADYEAALHGPLRQLDPEIVAKYVWDAIHHTGTQQDFKYFVPRIVELAAANRLPQVDIELVLCRLSDADWQAWPAHELQAVTQVLAEMWDRALATHPSQTDVDGLLCGLGRAYGDLAPLLDAWARDQRHTAHLHVRDLILDNGPDLASRRLGNAWWRDAQDSMASVVTWLTSTQVLELLLTAVERADPDERPSLELAFDYVAHL